MAELKPGEIRYFVLSDYMDTVEERIGKLIDMGVIHATHRLTRSGNREKIQVWGKAKLDVFGQTAFSDREQALRAIVLRIDADIASHEKKIKALQQRRRKAEQKVEVTK